MLAFIAHINVLEQQVFPLEIFNFNTIFLTTIISNKYPIFSQMFKTLSLFKYMCVTTNPKPYHSIFHPRSLFVMTVNSTIMICFDRQKLYYWDWLLGRLQYVKTWALQDTDLHCYPVLLLLVPIVRSALKNPE